MPDFLQNDPSLTNATPAGPSARGGIRGPRTFRSRRPGTASVDTPPLIPGPSEGPEGEAVKKERKKRSKLFTQYYGTVFLLLIAGFAVIGYSVLNPNIEAFKLANETINVRLQELDDSQSYLDSLDRSIAAAQSIPEETLERVEEALPREIGIPKLLKTMAVIAESNNISMTSIQFSQQSQGAASSDAVGTVARRSLELVPIDMDINLDAANYQITRAFLEDLERNVRVLDVRSITVNANDTEGTMSYTLQLTAYAVREAERAVSPLKDGAAPQDTEAVPPPI